MQIIFTAIVTVFITFLAGSFLVAMEKEIKKFKTIRKSVGAPISSTEIFIYVAILVTPLIVFVLYKNKSSWF